jgi:hypothetical protein
VGRQGFLKTPAETCQKTGFWVHAYWDPRRGVEPVGLDGGRTGSGTPECPMENGHRRPVAASNDSDPQMDCSVPRLGDVPECPCESTPMAEAPPTPR